jgi:hypothetical protein
MAGIFGPRPRARKLHQPGSERGADCGRRPHDQQRRNCNDGQYVYSQDVAGRELPKYPVYNRIKRDSAKHIEDHNGKGKGGEPRLSRNSRRAYNNCGHCEKKYGDQWPEQRRDNLVRRPDEELIAGNFRVLACRDQSGAAEKRPIKQLCFPGILIDTGEPGIRTASRATPTMDEGRSGSHCVAG